MMVRLGEAKTMEAAEKAKLEEEIRLKQEEVQTISAEVQSKDEETRRLQQEVEDARLKQQEAADALLAASTPVHHHVEDHDQDENDELANGDISRDLGNEDDGSFEDPVNERRTATEKNERLQEQLLALKDELAVTRDDTMLGHELFKLLTNLGEKLSKE